MEEDVDLTCTPFCSQVPRSTTSSHLIRSASALARMLPTLDLIFEENAVRR